MLGRFFCNKKNKDLKKEGKEPFKPIFGCELYVARRTKEDKEKYKKLAKQHELDKKNF